MRFASLWTGVLLGSLAVSGCSVSAMDGPADLTPGAGGAGEDVPFVDATVSFEGPASIDVSPGEVRALSVTTSPPSEYEMYFTLLDAPGDASLDASHLFAGADGRAMVKLQAPSSPASFKVRASIKNGPSADLVVTVSKQGVGALQVVPVYDGQRPVETWVASVVAGTTCSDLAAKLPGETSGALVAAAPAPESPVIQSVPVGPKLAVAVRAGHYAWGCGDTSGIAAGTTTKVKVHVVDVPPALDRTKLDLALAYAPDAPYGAIVTDARAAFLDAFLPPGAPVPAALLDAMARLSIDPEGFALAREALGWDALAQAHFAELPVPLGERMAGWIDAGLALGPAKLTGQLLAIDGVPGKALLAAGTLAGLDAAAAGVPETHLVSWTSQPGDKVVLSGTVYWVPSRFIGAACRAGAQDELAVQSSMQEVLAAVAGCNNLAATLGEAPGCDAACLADLCRAALDARWQSALDVSASAGQVGTIEITASGKIDVDDIATPVALTGAWIGHVSDGAATADVKGDLTGALVSEQKAPQEPPAGDPPPQ